MKPGDTWDKDTLYYSNGKNSGIKLEVTASDADSITLNVTVPQVQGSGTKDDPFLVSSVDKIGTCWYVITNILKS